MSVFKSNQWFSKTGDGKLVQEIPAEVDGEEVLTRKFCHALPINMREKCSSNETAK